MDSLSGYLDNMAAVDINGGSEFDQYMSKFTNLASNNTTLENTVNKQQNESRDLCRENNYLKKKLSADAEPGGGGNEQKSVGVRNPDFPGCGPSFRWIMGAY